MKKLYVLIVVAMLAALVLPMTAAAAPGDDPWYISGKVYDKTNDMGIGGASVELYYERSTIVSADRWDPDRVMREWELVDTCVTESRGFWQVEILSARTGRIKVVVSAPEDALLPDGQAVTYTADGTMKWNMPGPDDGGEVALPENAELGPNQCEWIMYNADTANFGWPWFTGDVVVNFVADAALTPAGPCGYADMMYVYGMVYDPTIAGNPAWPDSKLDGIGGVGVQVWERWVGDDPLGVVDPIVGPWVPVHAKVTNGDGYYFFSVKPTDTPGAETYEYVVVVGGVDLSPVFNAMTCPPGEAKRVEANYNVLTGLYDSLHTLP